MTTAESLAKVLDTNSALGDKDCETSSSLPFSEGPNFSPNSPPTDEMPFIENHHASENTEQQKLKSHQNLGETTTDNGDTYEDDEENRLSFAYPCALEGNEDIKANAAICNSSTHVSASRDSPISSESQAMSPSPPIMDEEDIKESSSVLQHTNQDYNPEFGSVKQLSSPLKSQYNGRRHSMEDLLNPAPNPMHSPALNESLTNKRGYYKTYTREQLMKALEAVQTAKMSGEQAAKFFKVPRSTLHHHLRPMQYWCVYCQKDLRYKIEWKEHMATHKKKGSSSNKASKANHSTETKQVAAELIGKDQTDMVNGNHHKNNNDHSDPWPSGHHDHYITSSNALLTNQKNAIHKKDVQAKNYPESFARNEPTANLTTAMTTLKETDNDFNTRNAMPHRVTKINYPSDNFNGGAIGLGSASNCNIHNSNNYTENNTSSQTLPSTTMAAILYQGLANGSPAFTEYLTKLTRECPEGMDQLKYLSDYYYHNYYQQYEALNKSKQMAEYSTNTTSKSDSYRNPFPENLKESSIPSNTFSSDTLREYLLQGKVSTGQSWDKTNKLPQQNRLNENKSIKESTYRKDDLPKTYSSQNYSNELRGLMQKSENEQRSLSPTIEYVCALCAITSNDKEQFLNHLFLHNQIFLVSNVNGAASNGTEKPNLKELNSSLLKTVSDITRMLDNIYQVDRTHGSWESLLNDVSSSDNNDHLVANLKNNSTNGNHGENKVKMNGMAKRDKPYSKLSALAAFSGGKKLNAASSIGILDKESTIATLNARSHGHLNYDKVHQDENLLKSLYQFPNLDQRLFRKPDMAYQKESNASYKNDNSSPHDFSSGLPFLAALKFNQHLEENQSNGYKETYKSNTSSRSTSLEIDEAQGDNKGNAQDLGRFSVSEREFNESPDYRQDSNNLTSYGDLIKRLSKLYPDPENKFNFSVETLKQKFSKHFSDKLGSLAEKHNNDDASEAASCNKTSISNSHPTLTNTTFSSGNKRKAKFPLRLGSKQFCSQNVISTSLS